MKWVKIDVKPCANGLLCACEYDPDDGTVVVFNRAGYALGYFETPAARVSVDWLGTAKCSECGDFVDSTKPFCPSCGRKFVGEIYP